METKIEDQPETVEAYRMYGMKPDQQVKSDDLSREWELANEFDQRDCPFAFAFWTP
jgi:hypothetical protein